MQKKIKSVIAIFLLTVSIPMLQTHKTLETDPTYLKVVNPVTGDGWFNFTTETAMAGDTFVVNITVADVTDLQCWEVKLTWNASLLDFVSISRPQDHVFAPIDSDLGVPPLMGRPMIAPPPDAGQGYVLWGCTYQNWDPCPYWTFNGTGTLCQLTLNITQAVGQIVPQVDCALAFASVPSETFLLDGGGYDISFDTVDGSYDYRYIPGDRVISIIDAVTGSSSITLGTPGQPVPPEGYPFTVNVTLEGLIQDLFCFEIALSFDKTKIACIDVSVPTEDPDFVFARSPGGAGTTGLNNDLGYVSTGATAQFSPPPPSPVTISHGIFCQVNFKATNAGICTIDIIPSIEIYWTVPATPDTFLWDMGCREVPFTSRSLSVSCGIGIVQPPPISIGGNDYVISIESNTAITALTATRNTLHFSASGPPGETGYINTTIPVGLNKTAIMVFIDKVKLTPPPYPIITTNGTHYFVYFEFTLSTHDIDIGYATADIATTNLAQHKTVIGQGYSLRINATLQNEGDYEETFNVTVCANTTIIASLTNITLTSGNHAEIVYSWNVTGLGRGNYTITICAEPVPDEVETGDNNVTGWMFVTIAGDVTSTAPDIPDGRADMRDIGALCNRFNWKSTDPDWNPNYDVNDDNVVNMRDIGIACNNFMK